MISKTDIEQFVRRKCGLCESMLMNTPSFSPSTTLHPAPEPGQVWTRDTLKFRVSQFQLKSIYVSGYSDKASGLWVLIPHIDYTAETVIELDQTAADVQPSGQRRDPAHQVRQPPVLQSARDR